ncbi:response regulator transcription factor [Thiomicrorhabdus sp. 6S3-12]|uniref:response regulator transcription factor n=1 Tax=Thiomicrorhabdus sp. 6S3-12 TaxID=2819681 RepID=UPI001AAC9BCA|nr:response regulator transcription factor [Thiomicrorhabdus sp. 6S3-12]MBO1925141.1 response regulator [Thiomicrorhabdus sp. 6S3-12]
MQNTEYRIAIIEDDPIQLETLVSALEQQGFVVEAFSDRPSAEAAFAKQLPDLVISDIILGSEMDGGFDLAKHLLSYNQPIPIIFLSERQSEFDIYTGHALGAIDYLPKPISLNVLIVKVKNLLRITSSSKTDEQDADKSKIKELELSSSQFKAYWHGKPLDLTATEFEMLRQFATAGEGNVVTYDALQQSTQGVVERNTINTHICRIRNAFKKITPEFNLIQNEYGRGYSWQQETSD